MTIRLLLIAIGLGFFSMNLSAQFPYLDWVISVESTGKNKTVGGYSLTTDVHGNLYVTGTFRGTADFDPSEAILNLTASESPGSYSDIFVQKLDNNGNLLWAKSVDATPCPAENRAMKRKPQKVSLHLSVDPSIRALVERLQKKTGAASMTEVIRHALETYDRGIKERARGKGWGASSR